MLDITGYFEYLDRKNKVLYFKIDELDIPVVENYLRNKKFKKLRLSISLWRKPRSNAQNNFIHLLFNVIGESQHIDPEYIKLLYKKKWGVKLLINGEIVDKPTSKYTIGEANRFIEHLLADMAEMPEIDMEAFINKYNKLKEELSASNNKRIS